jgi:hypothetical protein
MIRSEQEHENGEKNMRSKLLIASIFAGLLAGSGMAAAQIVDDPPGSAFQTQQNREGLEGVRGTPSVNSRTARAAAAARQARGAAAAARQARAYAYIPVPVIPHHKVVRHHHHR